MASPTQVREYLAHWFQLGKPVVQQGTERQYLPAPIFHNSQYSKAFEHCWEQISASGGENWYLAGTDYTIANMLSSSWDVIPCARCEMPVVVPTLGVMSAVCPCHDLASWPNQEIPAPRLAADTQNRLGDLQTRLGDVKGQPNSSKRGAYDPNDDAANVFSSWRGNS